MLSSPMGDDGPGAGCAISRAAFRVPAPRSLLFLLAWQSTPGGGGLLRQVVDAATGIQDALGALIRSADGRDCVVAHRGY